MKLRDLHIRFYVDRDIEKSHGCGVVIGGKDVRTNFNLQWRSWQPDDNGHDPWYWHFSIFVAGSFLGKSIDSDRRCCSNGITILSIGENGITWPEPNTVSWDGSIISDARRLGTAEDQIYNRIMSKMMDPDPYTPGPTDDEIEFVDQYDREYGYQMQEVW